MKRISLLVVMGLSLSLGSCQCSDKPDIAPVEDQTVSVAPVPALCPSIAGTGFHS